MPLVMSKRKSFWGGEGRGGEKIRPPPKLAGFKSRLRLHKWVEFVVGSLRSSTRFFSWHSGFPSPELPTLLNSNSFIPVLEGKQITVELRSTDTCFRTPDSFPCPRGKKALTFSNIYYIIYIILYCVIPLQLYIQTFIYVRMTTIYRISRTTKADR